MLRPPTMIFRSLHGLGQSFFWFVTLFQAIQYVELMASITRLLLGHMDGLWLIQYLIIPLFVQIVWLLMIQGTTQPDEFSIWLSSAYFNVCYTFILLVNNMHKLYLVHAFIIINFFACEVSINIMSKQLEVLMLYLHGKLWCIT